MNLPKSFKIKFDNYTTEVWQISSKLQYLERSQVNKGEHYSFDVFPESWFLFISNMSKDQIKVKIASEEVSLNPPGAVFLPPSSLIRWKEAAGFVKWCAFRGESPIPKHIPKTPFYFSWDFKQKLNSINDIWNAIDVGMPSAFPLPAELNRSLLARKFKKTIDENYSQNLTLFDMSKLLLLTQSNLSHTFRSCYGVNPLDYLNRLRLNQAIRKMSFENKDLTESCYESGFEDYSSFYRQFKSWLDKSPSYVLFHKEEGNEKTIYTENNK